LLTQEIAMTKLVSVDETIPVHIDGITIHISPLSYLQKAEVQEFMFAGMDGDMMKAMQGAALAIKYAVKGIEGVTDSKGNKFSLELEEGRNVLKDSSVDNLLNLPQNNKISVTCSTLLAGLPSESILHPTTGEPLEGIVVGDLPGKQKKKRR